jgi:Uma2 family endonuclease
MSEAQYLAFERASEFKHEFIRGDVVAMTGASEAHNLISVNLIASLKTQLRGRPCKIYPGDMRLKVEATGLYTYPDISVVCGDARFVDGECDTLTNPTVLIEVLSPSTEGYDRGKKFQEYRQLASLQEYLLVSQDSPRIERFLLQETGLWELTDAVGLAATLELPAIDCTLALTDVYEQVTFAENL